VTPAVACAALGSFLGVKRRLECLFDAGGIRVYDDFAHHPTAIATTLEGLRRQVGDETIVAILEPRSNTMKLGVHRDQLGAAVACADRALWYRPQGLDWSLDAALGSTANSRVVDDIEALLDEVAQVAAPAHLVIMSNGGFQGFQRRLVARLTERRRTAS
jgi:UDP-N-acetylmuramate: L-alanyl-gamma-D-glutamyl-meso-diaminopimelate ligase